MVLKKERLRKKDWAVQLQVIALSLEDRSVKGEFRWQKDKNWIILIASLFDS